MPNLAEAFRWFLIGFIGGCGFHLAGGFLAWLGGLIARRPASA